MTLLTIFVPEQPVPPKELSLQLTEGLSSDDIYLTVVDRHSGKHIAHLLRITDNGSIVLSHNVPEAFKMYKYPCPFECDSQGRINVE